ncbi:MAG: TolC family protein [Chitinophagaceae bacterium]|nr:TolC family protein [Chitinophagaceae bacterium]
MKQLHLLFFLMLGIHAASGQALDIDECYRLARQHYPLTKQYDLIQKSNEYSIANVAAGYLPQLNINGQAAYQSDVTQIPVKVPGVDIPEMSKDQYKLYGEVTQTIFDGGVIQQQKQIQKAGSAVEEQSLEVELYKLNDRINQLFFGILLVDEQIKQTAITNKDIDAALQKTEASIANGVALKSNGDVLKAEMLKNDQRAIELKAMRKAYALMLSAFTGTAINETTVLLKPPPLLIYNDIKRPELDLFEKQAQLYDAQYKLVNAKNLPKFGLFLQGGMGRPALNMLSNKLEPYYLGGVRLNWSLSGFYTAGKEKLLLDIKKKNTGLQKETFLFNTGLSLKQQQSDADKWKALLETDNEMIRLRSSVKKAAAAQLENGIITSSDFIREVNAEDQALQNKMLHEIQLLLTLYNVKWHTGN